MAEILGAVSAGVALAEVALKIGAGVFELKHMWEGVKGIPETIKLLVEDIEILGTVLKVMETEFNKPSMLGVPWSSGAVSLVVLASRSALDTLTVSINEISKDIESEKRIKRMLSKGKIALQKDVWAKHQKRLERVKWMVQTAQQLWAGMLGSHQQDLLISCAEQLRTSIHQAEHSPGKQCQGRDDSHVSRSLRHTRQATAISDGAHYELNFRFPTWLTRAAWSIAASYSYTGLKFNVRLYSVVPFDAPVMKYARNNDKKNILALFDKKLASPFDVDEYGATLIDYACFWGDVEYVSTLIGLGLDYSQCFNYKRNIGLITLCMLRFEPTQGQALHELALANNVYEANVDNWLLPDEDAHNGHYPGQRTLQQVSSICWDNYFMLKQVLPHLRPGHYTLRVDDRAAFYDNCPPTSDCLRYLLWCDGKLNHDDIQDLYKHQIPILNHVAASYRPDPFALYNARSETEKWRRLACEIIQESAPLHHIVNVTEQSGMVRWRCTRGTPLQALIGGRASFRVSSLKPLSVAKWICMTELSLKYWLEDLKSCGTDLMKYGREEATIFGKHDWIRALRYSTHRALMQDSPAIKLLKFTYGPEPEEWKFTWDVDYEEVVGEFWEMVEDVTLNMIGAWVD